MQEIIIILIYLLVILVILGILMILITKRKNTNPKKTFWRKEGKKWNKIHKL